VLDVLAGPEPGDATWAPPPPDRYALLAARAPARLRVGLATAPPFEGATVDPVCEAAARDAAALLESLGHDVEEITPPWSGQDVLADFTRAFGPLISFGTWLGGRIAGHDPTEDDVEPLTWALWERTNQQDTLSYLRAQHRLESLARTIVAFLEPFDVLVTPALARRPVLIGEIHGRGPDPMGNYRRSAYFTPFTAIFNVTGQPAIALPLGHGEDGLPTAVQLIGPPAQEEVLLAVATQLEAALPWAGRVPVPASTGG
jgi:amidase